MASASASPLSHPLIPLLLFLPLILYFHPTAANTYTNITLGSTLNPLGPNASWPSPSGDFAFGFHPVDPSNSSSLFLLAVWFEKTANRTIVWSANRNNPVPSGSKLVLTTDGLLTLKDPTGQEVWNSSATGASHAAILDSGNLILVGSDSSIAWQSFDSPTDTILPSQVLSMGTQLWSKLTDADYSDGRFQFAVQTDGNIVFYLVAVPTTYRNDHYWASQTYGLKTQLVYNVSGTLYISNTMGDLIQIIWTSDVYSVGDYYQRATLDPDGALRHYVYPKNGTVEGWSLESVFPDADICNAITINTGSGLCGLNSFCVLNEILMPECWCPPQYSFIDPSRKYKGCIPDFPAHSCEADDNTVFAFEEMTNTDWPGSDYDHLYPMDEKQCRESCLSDCFCAVVTYNDTGGCLKKRLPLSNGRKGGSIGSKALIKVPKANKSTILCEPHTPLPPTLIQEEKHDRKRTLFLVVSSLLGSSGFLNLLLIAAIFLQIFSPCNRKTSQDAEPDTSKQWGLNLRVFTYKELEEATKGFSEELGSGAFGTVYKGVLPLGSETRAYIAVKKLHILLKETEKEFSNEVRSIGQTHHKNLVKLLGFCNEGTHRLLVYEYMSNGTLTGFLFGMSRPDWNQRVQIALGIARGLLYLHEECCSQIIHCDIKPSNILLDDNFVARISDFGLAKLLRADQTPTNTSIKGTKGYVAPEWFKGIGFTAKVDVYSFGVVLLEIICCRRNLKLDAENEDDAVLTDWAYDCYTHGRIDLLVVSDEVAMVDVRRWERFMKVAIWCIQEDPMLRPSMQKVTQMLDGAVEVPVPPDPSSFLSSIQ